MYSFSIVTHGGHLGADPEVKVSKAGTGYVTATMAVNTAKEKTSWYRVTAFGRQGDLLAQCRKGSAVIVSGDQEIEIWEGNDGTLRTDVRILANKVTPVSNFGDENGQANAEPAAAVDSNLGF